MKPSAVTAEAEQDGGRHHRRGRHGGIGGEAIAAALRPQPGADAVRRGQAIDRAPRQHHRIDRLDQIVGVQRIGLPGAGTAAPDVTGGYGAGVGQDDGDAGAHSGVVGLAHLQTRHVGDQVAGAGPGYARTAGCRAGGG